MLSCDLSMKLRRTCLSIEEGIGMAKQNRGRVIKKQVGWRGTCPLCNRRRVKLVWTKVVEGKKIKVCKICGNKA